MQLKDRDWLCLSYAGDTVVLNPIALRKAKIICNFGLSECNS